jgi:hypothetical protein
VFRGHAADGFAGAEETPENVDGEDALQAGKVDGVETRLEFYNAGVVDERGDGAELGGGVGEETDYIGFAAYIGLDSYGGPPFWRMAAATFSAAGC